MYNMNNFIISENTIKGYRCKEIDFIVLFYIITAQQAAHSCAACSPRLMFGQPAASVGFFKVTNSKGISCHNNDPIPDLKECSGYCQSRAKYTQIMHGFNNQCNCCQPSATTVRSVQLQCDDGSTMSKNYTIPSSCGCSACSSGS